MTISHILDSLNGELVIVTCRNNMGMYAGMLGANIADQFIKLSPIPDTHASFHKLRSVEDEVIIPLDLIGPIVHVTKEAVQDKTTQWTGEIPDRSV